MLDTLSYTVNPDRTIAKRVVGIADVNDVLAEVSALKAQRKAFDIPADNPKDQAVLDAAKANYDEQLALLTPLAPPILDGVGGEHDDIRVK